MAHGSTYLPTTRLGKWLDRRLPLPRLIHDQFRTYPTPRNLNVWYTFGGILTFVLAAQIVTGIVLASQELREGLDVERLLRQPGRTRETGEAVDAGSKTSRDVSHSRKSDQRDVGMRTGSAQRAQRGHRAEKVTEVERPEDRYSSEIGWQHHRHSLAALPC